MTTLLPRPEPLVVHCSKCRHEWAPCFTPIDLQVLSNISKSSVCPRCGDKGFILGGVIRPSTAGDPYAWLASNDTGISSLVIWRVMMGETPEHVDIPSDSSDFGRCHRLLQKMPAWRPRMNEVAIRYPRWRRIVDAWDELTALYEEELASESGMAPKTYARLQELRA